MDVDFDLHSLIAVAIMKSLRDDPRNFGIVLHSLGSLLVQCACDFYGDERGVDEICRLINCLAILRKEQNKNQYGLKS